MLLAAAFSGCTLQPPEAESLQDCAMCPELVRVPAGTFTMGSTVAETTLAGVPAERAPNEQPAVTVTIDKPFAIGRYELTIAEFRAYAEATGFVATPGCFGLSGRAWAMDMTATWDTPGHPVTDRYPAACLTAVEYEGYLEWLSDLTGATYRLPTEAEWEYVARLGALTAEQPLRAGDPEACELMNAADVNFTANFDGAWAAFECDDGYRITSPVGSYRPNKLGMYDVLGNVAELTADCFVTGHEGRPTTGVARITTPCSGTVFKGGSWAGEPSFVRPAFRVLATRQVRGNGFGLRVVRELD
jgi:formylglycine-generating enzyme required for sulfatase activity